MWSAKKKTKLPVWSAKKKPNFWKMSLVVSNHIWWVPMTFWGKQMGFPNFHNFVLTFHVFLPSTAAENEVLTVFMLIKPSKNDSDFCVCTLIDGCEASSRIVCYYWCIAIDCWWFFGISHIFGNFRAATRSEKSIFWVNFLKF